MYKGTVLKGIQRGGQLGYPTINIPLKERDVSGVYAGRVRIGEEEYIAAVFANQERSILEAHLLNFSGRELYGQEVEIELHVRLRDGAVFTDEEKLRAAIAEDVEHTRQYFKHA